MQKLSSKIDIRKVKNELRQKSKIYRASLDLSLKQECEAKILGFIFNLPNFSEFKTILCYVSTPIEVDTHKIIEKLLEQGKTVAVPKCIDGTRDMKFYCISSFEQLEKGTFGVLEPKISECEKLRDFRSSVCIIPALMFDSEGYRLGYGKGYYDRFLSKFSGTKIGICFEECFVDKLPHGYFDVAADILITEKKTRYISADRTVKQNAGK